MHEIRVSTVSAEEASYGVAELWADGELIGYTHFDDGGLMLRIEPRRDGAPVEAGCTAWPTHVPRPAGSSPATENPAKGTP